RRSYNQICPRPLVDPFGIVIAPPRTAPLASLEALLRSLAAGRRPSQLAISFRSRSLRAEELRLLTLARGKCSEASSFARTDGLPSLMAHEVVQAINPMLRSLEREGKAIEISARIEAGAPVCDALLRLGAAVVWGTDHLSTQRELKERDWRRLLPVGYRL